MIFGRATLGALAAATILALTLPSAASAQDAAELPATPVLAEAVSVDARTSQVVVSVIAPDYSQVNQQVSIKENGAESASSTALFSDNERAIEIALVVDVRNSDTNDVAALAQTISTSLDGLPEGSKVSLVTAGSDVSVESSLGEDVASVQAALVDLRFSNEAALLDAVQIGSRTFSDDASSLKTVVVLLGGADVNSSYSSNQVASQLVTDKAQLVTVGQNAQLQTISEEIGGLRIANLDEAGVAMAIEAASDRLLVSFEGTTEGGERGDLALQLSDRSLEFSYPAGANSSNKLPLQAIVPAQPSLFSFLGSPIFLVVSLLLAFVAISTTVWVLANAFMPSQAGLRNRLASYTKNDSALSGEGEGDRFINSQLMERAVAFTEDMADKRGVLGRVTELLERANLPIRAGEAMSFLVAGVVVAFALTLVTSGSILMAVMFAFLAGLVAYGVILFLAKRRVKQFEAQLPPMLQLLSGTLKAGFSLPQGLAAVAEEMTDPMADELTRAATEHQLGKELDEALGAVAERVGSPDFAWAVMAIGIQREVGGNLSELLMIVSDTMVARERLRREVSALTAEGRVSAGILAFMPPSLALVLSILNPAYISALFNNGFLGYGLILAAVTSTLIGLAWMKKVITIDA